MRKIRKHQVGGVKHCWYQQYFVSCFQTLASKDLLQNSKQIESEEKSIELKVGKQQLKLKVQNIHFFADY